MLTIDAVMRNEVCQHEMTPEWGLIFGKDINILSQYLPSNAGTQTDIMAAIVARLTRRRREKDFNDKEYETSKVARYFSKCQKMKIYCTSGVYVSVHVWTATFWQVLSSNAT